MLDTFGLPQSFAVEEIPKLLDGVEPSEADKVFNWCSTAILLERRGVDMDIPDILILLNLCEKQESRFDIRDENVDKKLASFLFVLKAFCHEFLYINNLQMKKTASLKTIEESYIKAVKLNSDPRISVMFADFKRLYEMSRALDQSDPFEQTIKAYQLCIESYEHKLPTFQNVWNDGSTKYEVYYSLATVLHRKINILMERVKTIAQKKGNKSWKKIDGDTLQKLQEEYRVSLEIYLEKAPEDHWFYAHGCFMLSTEWIARKSPPIGVKPRELYKRNVDEVKNSIELFDKGVKAVNTLIKWNPHEELEKSAIFIEALKLQKLYEKHGHREESLKNFKLPVSDVVVRELIDEEAMSWKQKLYWNLTDPRSVQFVYLFLFVALLLDPIVNFFGIFATEETK
eukprot:augustus_masked-scaffold_49-processed-gene-0.50-mRNA-1 protein AED:1.00 eAED:1.00 QI:0/-1/0/1/-1/1/1/0/398